MKKLSVLLLIMMMSVAAVSAEEEVKATKEKVKIPMYVQAGLGIQGRHSDYIMWDASLDIPLIFGVKIPNKPIAFEACFDIGVETKYEWSGYDIKEDGTSAFVFRIDAIREFPKEGKKCTPYVGGGFGFGSATEKTVFYSGDENNHTYGAFQLNVLGGFNWNINEKIDLGIRLDIGFCSLTTIDAGAYARFNF